MTDQPDLAPLRLLHIEPAGLCVDVEPGTSLLEAAEAGGIDLPNSCRNGTCRTCICQMRAGEVRYRIEWPGLSAEEKAEHWVLPCVAEAASDVTLDVPYAKPFF